MPESIIFGAWKAQSENIMETEQCIRGPTARLLHKCILKRYIKKIHRCIFYFRIKIHNHHACILIYLACILLRYMIKIHQRCMMGNT